jgi:hypothetical protein
MLMFQQQKFTLNLKIKTSEPTQKMPAEENMMSDIIWQRSVQ